jgi:polysaccharide biosynthesis/export protein
MGVAYSSALEAKGGTGSYQFAVIVGSLPAGLALDAKTGAIGGTPTAEGTFSYVAQVTDSSGAIATTGETPCSLQPPADPATSPLINAPVTAATPAAPAPPAAVPGARTASPRVTASDPAAMAAPRERKTPAPAGYQEDHPFVLGAEDMISVLIYGSPEFSGNHLIRPDGKITMPFLGDVMAAGQTPAELGTDIKERLKKYIVEPDVSVQVTGVHSKCYYIQGEVNKTGKFDLLVPTRVLEALVNAGGFRDFANQKKIVVLRVTGERMNFNYKDVIKGKKMDQNVFLKPGDIIIVK